jgi:hypothetical protein
MSRHAEAARGLVAWLVLGGLVSCAGSKDMAGKTVAAKAVAPAEQPGAPEATVAGASEAAALPAAEAAPPAAAGPEPPSETPPGPRKAVPAQLLGRTRADVETQLGELRVAKTGLATTPADPAMELRFRDGRCVSIRGHVPEDMDCLAVAAWLGYENAYPLRRSDQCQWPGLSMKHRLAEGVEGHYVPATREYQISLRR